MEKVDEILRLYVSSRLEYITIDDVTVSELAFEAFIDSNTSKLIDSLSNSEMLMLLSKLKKDDE